MSNSNEFYPHVPQSIYNIEPSRENNFVAENVAKVYKIVAQALFCYIVGIIEGYYFTNQFFTITSIIGTFVCLFMFLSATTELNKWYYLNGMGICLGFVATPLLVNAYSIDPLIVPLAATSTATIFGIFTFLAQYRRKEVLLYEGFLYSALSVLTIFGFVMIFVPVSDNGYLVYCTGGLLVFCGYIAFDTAKMYERIETSAKDGRNIDHYQCAAELFLDLINVFIKMVEILSILSNNKKKSDKKKSE